MSLSPPPVPRAWPAGLPLLLVPLVFVFDVHGNTSFALPKLTALFASTALGLGMLLWHQRAAPASQWAARLPRPLAVIVLVWLAWQVVTTALSVNPLRSLAGSPNWLQGLFTRLGLVALAWLACLIAGSSRARSLRGFLIAGSVAPLVYGLVQVLHLDPLIWSRPEWEVATFGNPNFLAGYLVILLPITAWAALEASRTRFRVGWAVLTIAQLIGLFFTDSRGGYVAAAVALGLTAWWRWRCVARHAQTVLLLLGAATLIGTMWVANGGDALGLRLDRDEVRYPAWETALRTSLARPITGWGPSTFDLAQPGYATPRLMQLLAEKRTWGGVLDRTHNLWLELAVETGVPGLLLWLALLAAVIGPALAVAEQNRPVRGLLLGGMAALVGGTVHQLFNPSDIGFIAVFWWVLGWVVGTSPAAAERQSPAAPEYALLATQLLALTAALGAVYAVRQWFGF